MIHVFILNVYKGSTYIRKLTLHFHIAPNIHIFQNEKGVNKIFQC